MLIIFAANSSSIFRSRQLLPATRGNRKDTPLSFGTQQGMSVKFRLAAHGYAYIRNLSKIPHAHRFSNSRIMLIWIIAALLAVNRS